MLHELLYRTLLTGQLSDSCNYSRDTSKQHANVAASLRIIMNVGQTASIIDQDSTAESAEANSAAALAKQALASV